MLPTYFDDYLGNYIIIIYSYLVSKDQILISKFNLEMVMQYGLTVFFAPAFPLAALFSLINNVIGRKNF